MKRWFAKLICLLLLAAAMPLAAQDLSSYEKRVSVKTLPNGLTVVLWRRPEAPVFSFFTLVDAGSAQDPRNETGLAHMMEHMAFKGTPDIGTTDYAAEKVALEKVEQTYAAYEAERIKRVGQDPQKLAQLKKAWQDAIAAADKYVVKNQFGEIVESHGGVGMNAFTSYDETAYMYSMPSNQIELWAALESDRMMHPVMREFYKERNVVMEERRMRTDSSPTGRLVEQFLGTAFMANPYHRPTIGYASDLQSFSATDAADFFKRHYVPSNMVIGLVGDLDPEQVFPIIERYFGQLGHHAQAGGAVHRRAAAELGSSSYAAGSGAAVLPGGLSSAELSCAGRRGVRRDQRYPVERPHLAPVSFAGARQENCCLRRRLLGLAGDEVQPPVCLLRRAAARAHNRRNAEGHPRRDRKAEDAGRDRRRASDVQDAHQGRPDTRARQQRRTGATACDLPDALWRLARALSLPRSRGQGDQGRHPARFEQRLRRNQSHRRQSFKPKP